MLNNEVSMRTSAEVCSQLSSYFTVVDNCVAVSDTNKQYCINPQTSYSPSPPIQSGSYTSVIISPNTHNTADIYNGFIRADLEVNFQLSKAIADKLVCAASGDNIEFNKIWVGFKDARDAIEKYEIVANGQTIYTQNFAIEESFLTACCANEVSKRADIYSKARHVDVWNNKIGTRCGTVLSWNPDETTKTQTIHLKIDLRRFLPLSNIKYLPAFAGKIELRLFFSCAGMVYCPVGPSLKIRNNAKVMSQLTLEDITTEFTPIGDDILMWTRPAKRKPATTGQNSFTPDKNDDADGNFAATANYVSSTWRKITVVDYRVIECLSCIPCFGIDNNVYTGLVQRYSNPQHPLTFPTQTLSFYTTTKALNNGEDKATITITPRFVDSIFCLFPLHHHHHTYFKNPQFKKFQLNCGGYGNIPSRAFSTTGTNPEFIEYCQNAMNVNGEQTGFNKEVIASLCNLNHFGQGIVGNYSNDRTSFFIGFATETDGTYQQGLTSLSPINFELIVSQDIRDREGNKIEDHFANFVDTPPLLCLLYDSNISILVQPNGMPPQVRIGNYDITTPE